MRHRMLGLICLCVAASVFSACARSNTSNAAGNTETTPAATPAPAPAPAAALTFADFAGRWNMRAVPESGDTTPTDYVMTAMPDSSAWSIAFANGLTVAAQASVSGDSVVVHAGPYSSVRRKGVEVTTDGVLRRQGDKLVGETVAHYKTTRPDSVLRLRTEGTRLP